MLSLPARTFSLVNYPPSAGSPHDRSVPVPQGVDPPALMEQRLREQLARELHDGPVQLVSNATMNLMLAQMQLERDPAHVREELKLALTTMQRAVQEMRAMLSELRPIVLETEGLAPAVLELVAQINQSTALEIHLDCRLEKAKLNWTVQVNVYYIIQEALQNVLKHARARQAHVHLESRHNILQLVIRDDGRGFDLNQVQGDYEKRKSFGLLNLYERAQLIQGQLGVDSVIGGGTTVRLTVPLGTG